MVGVVLVVSVDAQTGVAVAGPAAQTCCAVGWRWMLQRNCTLAPSYHGPHIIPLPRQLSVKPAPSPKPPAGAVARLQPGV